MGEIYKAHDTRLNRIVAIKVLPAAKSGDPERRQRFLQEAQAASGLNHPSIITIHDVLSEGDTEFMVMEYVAGKTLNDVIPKGGLRVPQALKYALQMADALNAAHTAGIVHRDLKPANVMVTEGGLVKVLDFGLAKLTDRSPVSLDDKTQTIATAPLTVEGSILGTVSYMSPEQAQGRKVDTRSDIFSFGVVLYEMLTGRRAFEGDSSLSTLSAILRDDVKPLSEVAPDVPPPLETLLLRCLQKDPEHRCQSMREVQIALSALKRDSDSGSLYTTRVAPPPVVKPVIGEKKPSGKMALIGVIAAVVVLGGAGTLFFTRKHATPPPVAQVPVETPAPAPAVETPAPEPAPAAPAAAPDGTLNNDGVLEMVKENVPAQVILGQIRSSKTNFDLSTPEVIRLTKGGVPAGVIEAMRNPKRTPAASAAASAPASAKQSTPARPEPVAPSNAPIPAPEPAPAPVAVAAPPPTVPPPPAAAPQTTNVVVSDAMPFTIALAANVPSDAEMGRPLRFTAVQDFRVRGVVVIPKGAAVTGQISDTAKKKFLGIGAGKLNFELLKAETAGGQQLSVRALAARRSDGATQRPVETNTRTGSKDIVAAQGTQYIAYIDGEQSVTVPQK